MVALIFLPAMVKVSTGVTATRADVPGLLCAYRSVLR